MRPSKFSKLVGINLLLLSAFIFLAELLLSNLRKKSLPVSSVPAAIWGKKIIYDASSLTGNNRVVYTRDSNGYRSLRDYSKSNLVLTIGGSTTDQRYTSDGHTWQDKLTSLYKNEYQFVNGGVDGQSSYGHIYSINKWHSKVLGKGNVKAIIFYIGANDRRLLDGKFNKYDAIRFGSFREQFKLFVAKSFFYKRLLILKDRYFYDKNKMPNVQIAWSGHGVKVDFGDLKSISSVKPLDNGDGVYYKSLIARLINNTRHYFPSAKLIFVQQQLPGCKFLTKYSFVDRHPENLSSNGTMCSKLAQVYLAQDQVIQAMPDSERPNVLKMYLGSHISDSGVYDVMHTNEIGSLEIATFLKNNLPL